MFKNAYTLTKMYNITYCTTFK